MNFQVESLVTMIHRMQHEFRNSQTTPTPGVKDKGKGKAKEVVIDSKIEELNGLLSFKHLSSKRQ